MPERIIKNNENICRVILINPRISGEIRYGKYKNVGSYLPPYGLLSIAGVLEYNGHIVKIADADSKKGMALNEIKKAILDFEPDVIGLSAYSIGRENLIETAEFIKSFCPALLVAGGPHIITFPDDLVEIDAIDLLAYGEGEYIMLDIVNYFLGKMKLPDIDGIIYKKDGNIKTNSPREFIKDLDSLPYPAFHLLDNLHEYKPMQLLYKRVPVLTLISGRGCPFNCIFCNSIWGRRVRLNSAEYIAGLVKKMVSDLGAREIMFYEDSFCVKKDRIYKLCETFIRENMNISWTCSANVRTLDEALLKKMKAAGCWLISLGIESGNDDVLKFIKKPARVEEVKQACAWAEKAGIKLRGFFMIGHPVDTEKTIRQTIDFAKSLPLLTVNFCILQLLPGSKVREMAHEYGDVNYDLKLGSGHPGEVLSFVPNGLTGEYLKNMQRRGYREFFVRPVQIWRLLKKIDSWEDIKKYFSLFVAFLKLYIKN